MINLFSTIHCVIYQNFTEFLGVGISVFYKVIVPRYWIIIIQYFEAAMKHLCGYS